MKSTSLTSFSQNNWKLWLFFQMFYFSRIFFKIYFLNIWPITCDSASKSCNLWDFFSMKIWKMSQFILKVENKNSEKTNVPTHTVQLIKIFKKESKRWIIELLDHNNITQRYYWTLQFSTNNRSHKAWASSLKSFKV